MNIQNMSALAKQLENLGLGDLGYSLIKRACFKPAHFIITQKIEKGVDRISFELYFERKGSEEYALVYYDAILQQEIVLNAEQVNGINVLALEKQMSGIDWKKAFELDERKPWNGHDKSGWEQEQKIEVIIDDLTTLESTDEGRLLSSILKLKHWNGYSYNNLFDGISIGRNKNDISQRFFFFEGQPGISVDEAYRFLQNRRMEKQMQTRKKQIDNQPNDDAGDEENSSSGSGLLKKRRINSSVRKGKNKSKIQ